MDAWTYYIYSLGKDILRMQIGEYFQSIHHSDQQAIAYFPPFFLFFIFYHAGLIITSIHLNIRNGRQRLLGGATAI